MLTPAIGHLFIPIEKAPYCGQGGLSVSPLSKRKAAKRFVVFNLALKARGATNRRLA